MSSTTKTSGSNTGRKFLPFPLPLAASIGTITKPVLKKQGLEVELITSWPLIVGADAARFIQPVKFNRAKDGKGVLVVDVLQSHALIAQHMQPLMLEKLAAFHGARMVERIKFQQKSHFPNVQFTPEFTPDAEQKRMLSQFAALKKELKEV